MTRIIIGQNESTAKNQFNINPKLQRTQATGNNRGFVYGTKIPDYPIIQEGLVTLPNRAVPRNLNKTPNVKRVVTSDKASLQGVPRKR